MLFSAFFLRWLAIFCK